MRDADGVLSANRPFIGFADGRADRFCLRFAKSAIAGGKVWPAMQCSQDLPEGFLLRPELAPTRGPAWLEKGALYLPYGGRKSCALSLAIALLAGALTRRPLARERPVQAGARYLALRAGLCAPGLFTDPATFTHIADGELTGPGIPRTGRPGPATRSSRRRWLADLSAQPEAARARAVRGGRQAHPDRRLPRDRLGLPRTLTPRRRCDRRQHLRPRLASGRDGAGACPCPGSEDR